MANQAFTFSATLSNDIVEMAKASRKTRDITQPIHDAYITCEYLEQQKAIEQEFRVLWIAGDTNVSREEAATILGAGKGKNAIDGGAVMRSYRMFQYHIVREEETVEVKAETKEELDVSDEILALALRLKLACDKADKKLSRKLATTALANVYAK